MNGCLFHCNENGHFIKMALKDQSVAFVGAGNIGKALIGGLFREADLAPERISASRRSVTSLLDLEQQFPGIRVSTSNTEMVKDASVVVLTIKPQSFKEVLDEIKDAVRPDALVISVLAGIRTEFIAEAFGKEIAVVRSMPNTPALVDEAATAICPGAFAMDEHIDIAKQLFNAVGKVEEVQEHLMDAVTGLSGSGPAYIFMVIEALTDAGVKQGLNRAVANRLASQTVYGSAKLAIETGKHPAILRDEVTTPGGTTISAIAELESHGLRTMLINAVATATQKSRELNPEPKSDS